MFDEMTVSPSHLACIEKTVADLPPKPGEDDFDRKKIIKTHFLFYFLINVYAQNNV